MGVSMTLRPAPSLLATILRWRGFRAITLPPFGIYALPECCGDARLLRHEQEHWRQYERMGVLKFYAVYLWYSLKYGYRNNPMEIEARKAERLS
jgi:hypothetical protein